MTREAANSRTLLLATLVALPALLLDGCSDRAEEAYQASYEQAYQAARRTSGEQGREAGGKLGADEARRDADSGEGWRIYAPFAYGALFPGIVIGLFVQYAILFSCRLDGRLPSPGWFAFVPGMKGSLCYTIFKRRFRLLLDFDQQLHTLLAARKLKIARVDAVHDAVRRRVMAAASIEELTAARFVEIANNEINQIIAGGERAVEFERRKRFISVGRRNVCRCPHCGKRVKFPRKVASTTVSCPHPKCGGQIALPPSN